MAKAAEGTAEAVVATGGTAAGSTALSATGIGAIVVGAVLSVKGVWAYEETQAAKLREQEILAGHLRVQIERAQKGTVILEHENQSSKLLEARRREALRDQGIELGTAEPGTPAPRDAKGRPRAKDRKAEVLRRHRSGNQQVLVDGRERWHLAKGAAPSDLPTEDPVGDSLQEAVNTTAARWSPDLLSEQAAASIADAKAAGKWWQVRRLEAQAKGRFVESEVKLQFPDLQWSGKGVDATDPKTGLKYEVLSGTRSNLDWHAKRMSDETFRMIAFGRPGASSR